MQTHAGRAWRLEGPRGGAPESQIEGPGSRDHNVNPTEIARVPRHHRFVSVEDAQHFEFARATARVARSALAASFLDRG